MKEGGAKRGWNGAGVAGGFAWAGVAALFVAVTVQKLWSADTWTLLSIGRWVAEHRAWPRVEEWSYTAAGRDWHELRWLFGMGMYGLWEVGGAGLVVAGQSALVGAMLAVLVWPVRGRWMDAAVVGVVALGLCAGASRWVMRPELVTYVMVAVFLGVLGGARTHGPDSEQSDPWHRKWLWVLPLLQVVWTNAHPMFVFGPVLTWTAVGAELLQIAKRPKGQSAKAHWGSVKGLVVVAVLVSAACLVNPYFVEGALQPVRLFVESRSGHAVSRSISEMRSVFSYPLLEWRWDTFGAVGLVVLAAAMSAACWRRVGWFRVLVLVQACYLIAGAQRNVGLATVMGMWVVLGLIAEGVRQPRVARWGSAGAVAVGCACLVAAWFVASDRYWPRNGIGKEFGFGVVEGSVARGAADFVIESGVKGKIYNSLQDGGYLIWRGIVPVYVDGRMEIRSEEFLREYFEGGWEFWMREAAKWGINTVVLPRKGFEWLERELVADAAWARVYEDGRSVVFVRVVPSTPG